MKGNILFLTALVLAFFLAGAVSADGTTLYVDDDDVTCGGNSPCYSTIQEAVNAANDGDTIMVAAGTYYEAGQIVINKNLTIIGVDKVTTIIKPDHDTTVAGYVQSDAWIYVPSGVTFALSKVTLDGTDLYGTPRIIRHAIQSRGELTVEDCIIKNITTNNKYYGRGIVLLAGTSNTIARCEFSNIQRIGIHVRGNVEPTNPVAHIEDCTYAGKGDGDWLDYGIEFGGGGSGTVDGCDISACTGVASVDGSTSAGILATDYFGSGTEVSVENSILRDNTAGIAVGYAADDATELTAHQNTFNGNDYGIKNVGVTQVDAEYNWWGHCSGPYHPDTNPYGTGDAVSDNVDYDPWNCIAEIDIKPGNDNNNINLNSNGVVSVAVLNTDYFDVSSIDTDTVKFAGASQVKWILEDMDADGDIDMIFHFRTQELELDEDSSEATLCGSYSYDPLNTLPFCGTDAVAIVPTKTAKVKEMSIAPAANLPESELTKIVFIRYAPAKNKPCNGNGACEENEGKWCSDCKNDNAYLPTACYDFLSKAKPKWNWVESYSYSTAQLEAVSDSATSKWNGATSAAIFGNGILGTYPWGIYDYKNSVSFGNYPDGNVIAVTGIWFRGKTIYEYDIMFDTDYFPGDGTVDLYTVALHEFGHAAGLDDLYDSVCEDEVMYGIYAGEKSEFGSGDLAGITALYGE